MLDRIYRIFRIIFCFISGFQKKPETYNPPSAEGHPGFLCEVCCRITVYFQYRRAGVVYRCFFRRRRCNIQSILLILSNFPLFKIESIPQY
jgi:hypothetical protein